MMDSESAVDSFDKNIILQKDPDPREKELEDFEQTVDETYHDLQKMIKQLRQIKNKIPKLKNSYRKLHNKLGKKDKNKKLSGFYGTQKIPSKMAVLIGVDPGTEMNRVQLVSKLIKVLKEKGLYYEENKQVFRADDQIKKLLKLPDDVNQQTDPRHPNSLSIYTIHSYVANCFKKKKKKIIE